MKADVLRCSRINPCKILTRQPHVFIGKAQVVKLRPIAVKEAANGGMQKALAPLLKDCQC